MFKLKPLFLGFSLLVLGELALLDGKLVQGQNNPKKPLPDSSDSKIVEAELISIAEANIRSEYDVQVNGDEEGALKRNGRASKVRDVKFRKRLAKAKELRKFLSGKKVGYKGFQTKLEVTKVKIEGDTATIEATEKTARDYDLSIMASDSPEKTETYTDHRFTFNLRDKQWELTSHEANETI
jgi:hypothetical protein